MGRPRTFDEAEAIQAAAALFAHRPYDGISVDDLVGHLGVHRNSLYKVFGSKRGLYLAALRWHLQHRVRPNLTAQDDALDLLLLALIERAPEDTEVAAEIAKTLHVFDTTLGADATATLLGRRLRARAG